MSYSTETQHLRKFLDRLYSRFNHAKYLTSDPLEYAHHYKNPMDQEVVAIISAMLAYGNASQVRKAIALALKKLSQISNSPYEAIQNKTIAELDLILKGFYYRFNSSHDLACLLYLIALSQKKFGSVGNHFLSHLDENDLTIENTLTLFLNNWNQEILKFKPKSSFNYFLTNPKNGSTCKRWCMLIKWLTRQDNLDLGIWKKFEGRSNVLRKNQLVMPLDTHVARISRYIGLTRKNTTNWKTSLDVTQRLREIHSEDPTRYDFAMSRLGILKLCKKKYFKEICTQCDLLKVCNLAKSKKNDPSK